MNKPLTRDEMETFRAVALQDIGWFDWAPKPKPKAKISYGKKGKRKSVEVKR